MAFYSIDMALTKTNLGTIRFALRVDKVRKDGTAPIEITYRVAGSRLRPQTKIFCYPPCWDNDNQRAVYINKSEAKLLYPEIPYVTFPYKAQIDQLNNELSSIVREISNIELLLRAKHPDGVTGRMVVDEWKLRQLKDTGAKKEEPNKYLLDFINQYIDNTSYTASKGSTKIYKVLARHLHHYQQGIILKGGKTVRVGSKLPRITIISVDYAFVQGFHNYLIGHVGQLNTTAAKQISTLKTFLNKARKMGHQVNGSYQDFSVKRDKLEVIALNQDELHSLIDLDLTDKVKLRNVRDVFVFGCFTGLRYSDLKNLTRDNIKDGYLQITVHKTRQSLTVPLMPDAVAILDKYSKHIRPLPVISNQKMNDYIKEVCEMAGITEPIEITRYKGSERVTKLFQKYELITCHSSRKTFVTISLEKGMKAEEIMPITGHSSYESFKRYLNVTKKQVKTALLNAWGQKTMKIVNDD